jgi:hypothetical protein
MRRTSITTSTAVILFSLAACTSTRLDPASSSSRSIDVPTESSAAAPPTTPQTVIELPRLPRTGIVAQSSTDAGSGVDLLSMNGRSIARLRGFNIANPLSSPGIVVLRRNHTNFRLFVTAHVLRETPHYFRNSEPPKIGPPFPRSSGSWVWTSRSPDGRLGEWQEQISECSLLVALIEESWGWAVLSGPTSPPRTPYSIGLGWTGDGRPVAAIQGGPCNGVTHPRTGVYVVTGDRMERIPTSAGSYTFRMWGSPARSLRRP